MADVILFDGVCNFCNASVNFVIDRDTTRRFRFASLQSAYGQQVLHQYHRSTSDFDTILLIREEHLYERSTAALEIARYLKGWGWLYGFRFVPRFLRDTIYDFVARHRYRIFGRSEVCRVPTPEEKALFL